MIDASIPLQVKAPQIEDPTNALLKVLQMKAYQQEGEMNGLKAEATRRDFDRTNKLYTLLQSNPDAATLRQNGFLKESMELEKNAGEVAHKKSETTKNDADTENKTIAMYRDASQAVGDYTSAVDFVKHMHTDPRLANSAVARVPLDQVIAQIPQDPQQLAAWKQQFGLGATKFIEMNKPQFITSNTGGQTVTTGVAGLTGQTTPVQKLQNTQSPDNAATNARAAAEGAANRSVAMRGQDLTNQRQVDQNNIQSGQRTQQGVIELRKEFNTLPEVKNFKEVLPIIESVQRAPNTPAGDIDLIYGVGKVMDPNSVVREGEMKLVIQAGSPAQRLQGFVSYVQGGGRLSSAQRQELMTIMNSRVQGLKSNYDNARKTYETAADRQGLPRDQIFIENQVPAAPPVSLDALPTGPKGGQQGRGNSYQPAKVVHFGDLK